MAINPGNGNGVLTGDGAMLAQIPLAQTPRGGTDSGFRGITVGAPDKGEATDQNPFAGLGAWLEDSDEQVYKNAEALVRRQDLLSINRWNQDEYYKCIVDGYPWATLQHDQNRDTYTFELPYGVSQLSIQPVPNKNLDLVNKTSEQLLVDFPEADAQPIDDSEEAEQAAEAADRFLSQDGGEQGTNDAVLFDDRVKLALATATSYLECWTDPTGGGYVPLQINAHPAAQSPDQPLLGPDGNPSTDTVLRYVTSPEGGQFTNDPTQAAPQWQPKIRASKWAREHVCIFPENRAVDVCDRIIIRGYCTIGEAKKRWQAVADMDPDQIAKLCDWTPPRYLQLLPRFQRATWQLSDGKDRNKGGPADERIMFYFHIFEKACPDYPKGADVVVSGVSGGLVLDRKLLSTEVEVMRGQADPVKETRCREIPVVQITPRGDPYGQDPTGKCYLSLFVGATEWNAAMAQGFAENMDKNLHTPFASSNLSAITGKDVEAARRSGDILKVLTMNDVPQQLQPPVLPNSFFSMYELSDEAINSIASRERAASGADNSKERSGKALQIAVSQNSIGNSSMLTAVNNAYSRWCRIKLEVMMSDCTTVQQISYVGEDGSNKMQDLKSMDFALVGKVGIKAGTGTGLTQDAKVQYLGNLKAEGFIGDEESMEAARPSFAKRLGIPANPHDQYVSRAIDSWLEGPPGPKPAPPDPTTGQPPVNPQTGQPAMQRWQDQYRAWMTAQQQFEQAQQLYQQQVQQYQQFLTSYATAQAGPPPDTLGPEGQHQKAGTDFEQAKIAVQVALMQNPQIGTPPVQPQPPTVPKPWVPFEPRPNDTEPELSHIWVRKLSKAMSTVKYGQFKATEPEWTDVLNRQYDLARKASATAGGAPKQPVAQQSGNSRTPATNPTAPTAPTVPVPNLAAGA